MSGGHFNYKQFHIDEIADTIESLLNKQGKPKEPEDLYGGEEYLMLHPEDTIYEVYSQEVHDKMKDGLKALKLAAIYTRRIDLFLSGDDGAESFLERLSEDLKALTNNLTQEQAYCFVCIRYFVVRAYNE
jgi:hypothetical protein